MGHDMIEVDESNIVRKLEVEDEVLEIMVY